MRHLNKPKLDYKKVFELCVNSIGDASDRKRFYAVSPKAFSECDLYLNYSNSSDWYNIQPNLFHEDTIVCGDITKKELKSLYTNQLVGLNKKGRKVYDYLFNIAPYNKCPFCGFSTVETLDHYLPKAKFPFFSVLPENLVPSCNKCNKGKSSGIATVINKQTLHPYYDDVNQEQWLFARLKEDDFIFIEFYLDIPTTYSSIMQERIQSHFVDYHLSNRFSIEAASRLATLREVFIENAPQVNPLDYIRAQLKVDVDNEFKLHKNSWETAMYQALHESDWYCHEGFQNDVYDPTAYEMDDDLEALM